MSNLRTFKPTSSPSGLDPSASKRGKTEILPYGTQGGEMHSASSRTGCPGFESQARRTKSEESGTSISLAWH